MSLEDIEITVWGPKGTSRRIVLLPSESILDRIKSELETLRESIKPKLVLDSWPYQDEARDSRFFIKLVRDNKPSVTLCETTTLELRDFIYDAVLAHLQPEDWEQFVPEDK